MNIPDYYVIAKREDTEYRYYAGTGYVTSIDRAERYNKSEAISKLHQSYVTPEKNIIIRCSTILTPMEVLLEEAKKVYPEQCV